MDAQMKADLARLRELEALGAHLQTPESIGREIAALFERFAAPLRNRIAELEAENDSLKERIAAHEGTRPGP